MNELEKAKKDMHDHIYKWYVKYNGIYAEKINELENKVDNIVISIAGGAIVLTITFFNTIVDTALAENYACLIKISWIFFIISIVSTLTANRVGVSALTTMKSKLKDGYQKSAEKILNNEMPDFPDVSSELSKVINFLNMISFLSLVTGIIFAIIFAFLSF